MTREQRAAIAATMSSLSAEIAESPTRPGRVARVAPNLFRGFDVHFTDADSLRVAVLDDGDVSVISSGGDMVTVHSLALLRPIVLALVGVGPLTD